jgi:hypothetical protein
MHEQVTALCGGGHRPESERSFHICGVDETEKMATFYRRYQVNEMDFGGARFHVKSQSSGACACRHARGQNCGTGNTKKNNLQLTRRIDGS